MDDADDDGSFTHRRVSAAEASAPKTSGASSVFSMGSAVAPPIGSGESAAPERTGRGEVRDRALKFLAGVGSATVVQVAEAINRSDAQARGVLDPMCKAGLLRKVPGSKPLQYALVYGRKGLAPALGWKAPRNPVRAAAVAEPEPSAAIAEPKLDDITPVPLVVGLMNNGELHIETFTDRMRLTRVQTRALVDYLDMVSAALKAA